MNGLALTVQRWLADSNLELRVRSNHQRYQVQAYDIETERVRREPVACAYGTDLIETVESCLLAAGMPGGAVEQDDPDPTEPPDPLDATMPATTPRPA